MARSDVLVSADWAHLDADHAGAVKLDGSRETIATCRIGERSSRTRFVFQELLRHRNVKTTTTVGRNTAS